MSGIKRKIASNKTKASRRAPRSLSEEEAVDAALKAMQEPTLKGDFRALLKKMR